MHLGRVFVCLIYQESVVHEIVVWYNYLNTFLISLVDLGMPDIMKYLLSLFYGRYLVFFWAP